MLDRVLFAARRFQLNIGYWLGFWRLSIVLMVLAALYYLLLAIWAAASPPHVVRNIAHLLPFWVVYLALLVNTGTCFWRRLATLKRDLAPGSAFRDRPPAWTVALPAGARSEEALATLRGAGYRVGGGTSTVARGRWSTLGSYLFHGSFFVIALGFLLTFSLRSETTLRVAEGEILQDGPAGAEFVVRGITPEFWQDQLLFTQLEASLGWPDGTRSIQENVKARQFLGMRK
jgi:hypothetical protein